MLLQISQNSQENTWVSFLIKLQAQRATASENRTFYIISTYTYIGCISKSLIRIFGVANFVAYLNYFWLRFPFYTPPLKIPESIWFCVVFRGHKMGTSARNGLTNYDYSFIWCKSWKLLRVSMPRYICFPCVGNITLCSDLLKVLANSPNTFVLIMKK